MGDIGDNGADRSQVSVTQVGVAGVDIDAPTYDLVYPEGARDAESLLCDPTTGRLYVVSKGVFGGTLYAAPRRLVAGKPNRLVEVGPMLAMATDAAFFPDGRHLIVRNYTEAAVYSWPALEDVGHFGLPEQRAGRGHRGRAGRHDLRLVGGPARAGAADHPARRRTPRHDAGDAHPHGDTDPDADPGAEQPGRQGAAREPPCASGRPGAGRWAGSSASASCWCSSGRCGRADASPLKGEETYP